MKIYGTGIYENDRADLVGLSYLHFSISQIEDVIEWMKDTDESAQQLLGYLDMLLMIAEKFPDDANLKIKNKEFLNSKLFLMNGLQELKKSYKKNIVNQLKMIQKDYSNK